MPSFDQKSSKVTKLLESTPKSEIIALYTVTAQFTGSQKVLKWSTAVSGVQVPAPLLFFISSILGLPAGWLKPVSGKG